MAAPWSDPRNAVISLVYGSHTMRLSGEGVAISAASRRTGNQAKGLSAATAVNGAISPPMARRWPGASWPALEASTLSNIG